MIKWWGVTSSKTANIKRMMSSPFKVAADDYGQRNRTGFELSESGESKLIVDEVQYQIDCLRSPNATAQTKKKALLALVRVFSASVGRGLRQRLSDKIQDIFGALSQLLGRRSQWSKDLLFTGMLVIVVLGGDSDGSFDPTVVLPKRLLSAILQNYKQHNSQELCECTAAPTCSRITQTALPRTESTETGFHRRRKFTASSVAVGSTEGGRINTISTLPKQAGNKVEEPSKFDVFVCLGGTFWCATCIRRRDTEASSYCDVLQLIFLNRYLVSKVATLSSVHTDYFQNAHHAIQEEEEEEEGKASGTKGSGAVSAALRSPENPHSRSSKSFYQRQLDTLSKTQNALQDEAEDCGGDGRLSCYLHHLCSRLWQDTQLATEVLRDDSAGSVLGVKRGPLFGRMWLMLGILDAACFRSPYNQCFLASLAVEDGYQTSHRGGSQQYSFSILVQLLEALTPAVAASMRQQQHAPNIAREPTVGASRAAGSKKLPAHWMKFHGLFPEIPVVLSHSTKEDASEMDLFSDDAPISQDPPSRDVSAAPEPAGSASVGVLELFTAALKALTSLVTNCAEAAETVRSCEPGLVAWATRELAWCAVWRCGWAREGRTGKTAGALSPNETVYERFIFDSMLHLHSLLTHIHASGRGAAGAVDVTDHSYLLASLPQLTPYKAASSLSDAYLKKHCPTIFQLLNRSTGKAIPTVALPHLLAEVLYLETADFLQDLEETDAAINETLPPTGAEAALDRVASLQPDAPSRTNSSRQQTPSGRQQTEPRSGAKGTMRRTDSSSLPIPVAELVVAAHAALLLHTLEGDVQSAQGTQPAKSGRELILLGDTSAEEDVNRGLRAVNVLPRGDWWLCVRVLKAFLTLQGQTGIMLLDNIAPVVQALKYMQEGSAMVGPASATEQPTHIAALDPPSAGQEYAELECSPREHLQPSAAAPALVTTAKKAASKSACEAVPDRIDFEAMDDNPVTAGTRARTERDHGVAGSEQASGGKWEWNGYDYVWVTHSRLEKDEEQDYFGGRNSWDKTGSSVDKPIVLGEEDRTHRVTARLTQSTSSSSSSLNELAPSTRKRTYGRASSRQSEEECSSEEWGQADSQESGCSTGVGAPVTSLFPASSAAAPLRAPTGYTAAALKKPRSAQHGDAKLEKVKNGRSIAPKPSSKSSAEVDSLTAPKEPEAAVVDESKGGWRSKRKFVSAA